MQKNQQWKDKVQELFQVCQKELKKTTKIGKKMLSASKTNTNLHEAYEEIGRLAAKAIKDKDINWDNPRVEELIDIVENCKDDLNSFESEVNKIKFASGPVDISTQTTETDEDTVTDEVKKKHQKSVVRPVIFIKKAKIPKNKPVRTKFIMLILKIQFGTEGFLFEYLDLLKINFGLVKSNK